MRGAGDRWTAEDGGGDLIRAREYTTTAGLDDIKYRVPIFFPASHKSGRSERIAERETRGRTRASERTGARPFL